MKFVKNFKISASLLSKNKIMTHENANHSLNSFFNEFNQEKEAKESI